MKDWDRWLAPARGALAASAQARADSLVAEARDEAGRLSLSAEADAAEVLASARADGDRAGREQAAMDDARARRDAHRVVLVAREQQRLDLLRRVERSVAALTADPRYPELRARLSAECLARLGPGAQVRDAPGGGVVGQSGTRRLDLSLVVLADRAAEAALDAEQGEPW